jgi:dolichol-phosphate mannosyltransferase
VAYDRQIRRAGESKFPLGKLIALAVDGLITHSIFPLRLAAFIGLGTSVATCAASFLYIVLRLFFGFDWPAGFATTTVLLLFGISLNGIFLGIIGEYVGRIYNQVRSRPTTVIEYSVNLPTKSLDGLGPGTQPSLEMARPLADVAIQRSGVGQTS